jgi:hypothetical protein
MNRNKHIQDAKERVGKKHTSWGADQKTLLKIHQMIILSTLRYGETAYGSASKAVLRKLYPTIGICSIVLGTFVVCKTENVLCEAGLPTLTEMRDENTMKTGIRILTNETQITKILLHTSGRTCRTNGHRWKKSGENSRINRNAMVHRRWERYGLGSL